jgi:excisionase family DNA binding protein
MSSQPFFRSASSAAGGVRSLEVLPGTERESSEVSNRPADGPQGRESLLTVAQVAKRLGMSKQWVRDHIDRRHPKIDVIRWGSAVRFRPADIDRFILQHINAPRLRRRRA